MNMEYKEKQKGGLSAPDLCFFLFVLKKNWTVVKGILMSIKQ